MPSTGQVARVYIQKEERVNVCKLSSHNQEAVQYSNNCCTSHQSIKLYRTATSISSTWYIKHMTVRKTIRNMAGSGTYPGPGSVQASPLPGAGDITLSPECDVLIAYPLVLLPELEVLDHLFPTARRIVAH